MMFSLYLFGLVPLFIWAFVHLTRRIQDVDVMDFTIMIVISFIPILREGILLWLFSHSKPAKKTLFKRFDR